jgi:hypothetical protein
MPSLSEYFISHIINEEFAPGTKFDRWPLHMTIVTPFEIPAIANTDIILESISKIGVN